jgi:hypothetical protein
MEGVLVQVTAAARARAMMAGRAKAMMGLNMAAALNMAAMRVAKGIQILLINTSTLVIRPNGLLAP